MNNNFKKKMSAKENNLKSLKEKFEEHQAQMKKSDQNQTPKKEANFFQRVKTSNTSLKRNTFNYLKNSKINQKELFKKNDLSSAINSLDRWAHSLYKNSLIESQNQNNTKYSKIYDSNTDKSKLEIFDGDLFKSYANSINASVNIDKNKKYDKDNEDMNSEASKGQPSKHSS